MTREEAKALLESMQSDLDNVQAQIDGLEKEKGNCYNNVNLRKNEGKQNINVEF